MQIYVEMRCASAGIFAEHPELADLGMASEEGALLHVRLPEVAALWTDDPKLRNKVVLQDVEWRDLHAELPGFEERRRRIGAKVGQYLLEQAQIDGEIELLAEGLWRERLPLLVDALVASGHWERLKGVVTFAQPRTRYGVFESTPGEAAAAKTYKELADKGWQQGHALVEAIALRAACRAYRVTELRLELDPFGPMLHTTQRVQDIRTEQARDRAELLT